MKTKLSILILLTGLWSMACGQDIADVSDPSAIKLITPDQGIVITGTLRDTIANYPKLRDAVIAETSKKLASEDEIAAQRRAMIVAGQKVQLPKEVLDKHNARIAKFAKVKEEALLTATKKAQVSVTLNSTASQDQIDAQIKALSTARALAQKAKAKKDELISAGIPISDSAQKSVEDVQPKPTPAPALPSPTPNDGL